MGTCCSLVKEIPVTTDSSNNIHCPQDRYINRSYISRGGNSKIYKVYDKYAKTLVTCKQTPCKKKLRAHNEANIIEQFDSDILPSFINIQFKKNVNCLYYKFIPGTDLYTYFFKKKKIRNYNIKLLFKKMLKCLREIKKYNLSHLDIKLENFVFDDATGKLSLIDFEGSQVYPRKNEFKPLATYVGTISYAPPEILNGTYHRNSDIWSIGICLWCILTGQYPFDLEDITRNILSSYMLSERFKFPQAHHLEKMEEFGFGDDLKYLFDRMFKFDANKRISMVNLQDNKWLNDNSLKII